MQSTTEKQRQNAAYLRVALTPLVWLLSFACAMYFVVSAFFAVEMGQQIPFAVNAISFFVILGAVPANLAIYGILVEPTFRITSKRNRALAAWILFLAILATSLFVGFQIVVLLTEISWFRKLLLLAPFPIASTVTFGVYVFMSLELMKTIAPLVAFVASSMGAFAFAPDLNADEPLDAYLGDWLFREDRNQLSTGAKSPKRRGVVFFEKNEGVCGSIRRKWELHFDHEEKEFAGKLTTRFDNEEQKTFILGEWDQANATMTWTLDKDPLYAKIRHRFTQGKLIVTTLPKGDTPDRKFWDERGTFTPTAR